MTEKEIYQGRKLPLFFWLCLLFGLCVVALTYFQWDLVDYLTPFLIMPFLFLFWIVLIVLSISSLIFIPFRIKKISWKAFLPFIANGTVLLILFFVPFTDIWLEIRFRANRTDFEKVIAMYRNGELNPDDYGEIQLPKAYQRLSKSGYIYVDETDEITSAFFFTYRGILDNASGFLYRSNNAPPSESLLFIDCIELERMETNWFFCASY